jgi:hypothetical protein
MRAASPHATTAAGRPPDGVSFAPRWRGLPRSRAIVPMALFAAPVVGGNGGMRRPGEAAGRWLSQFAEPVVQGGDDPSHVAFGGAPVAERAPERAHTLVNGRSEEHLAGEVAGQCGQALGAGRWARRGG